MGWLRLVGSFKLYVSFAEYGLFDSALPKETYNFKEPTNRSHPIELILIAVNAERGEKNTDSDCSKSSAGELKFEVKLSHSWQGLAVGAQAIGARRQILFVDSLSLGAHLTLGMGWLQVVGSLKF